MMIVNIDFIASFFDIENNYFNIKKGIIFFHFYN